MKHPAKEWSSLDALQRYDYLQQCRRRNTYDVSDQQGQTIHLDGHKMHDVSSFYIHLGEQIRGVGGYFGSCLDSLADCFCGGFGLAPPTTIYWHSTQASVANLGPLQWEQFRALCFWRLQEDCTTQELIDLGRLGDGSEHDVLYWQTRYTQLVTERLQTMEPERGSLSFFEAVCECLRDNVELVLVKS